MADHHRESDEIRAYVHYGDTVKVTLPADAVKESTQLPRFGHKKCTTGDTPARWINMEKQACTPPLCTGNRTGTVNHIDSVSYDTGTVMQLLPIPVLPDVRHSRLLGVHFLKYTGVVVTYTVAVLQRYLLQENVYF